MKTATLIIIGDEILSGSTLDTNSNFMAAHLQAIGVEIKQILTISDELSAISRALQLAYETTDLILTTGGLGPTNDDVTQKAYAQFFQDKIVFSETLFERLRQYFTAKNKLDILELNRSQCEVLSKAEIFPNEYGTAPCQLMRKEGKLFFSLPGVPHEMKHLLCDQIIPFLQHEWQLSVIYTQTISVVGLAESDLAYRIKDWEVNLPEDIHLAYLPTGSRIKLKLTTKGAKREVLVQKLAQYAQGLNNLIGPYIIAWNSDKVEEILAEILVQKKLSISTAESCTAGKVARTLTSLSGSSRYFVGGVIPYASAMKVNLLKIKPEVIEEFTVVSEEVAAAMATSCLKLFKTDLAIATTGVAGPAKGEDGKEVGTVYYAIASKDEVRVFHLFLPYLEREDFIKFVTQKALEKCILWLEHSN